MDREFFKDLAHHQWNLKEMESGKMWGDLIDKYPFLV
jgi:hypothetical protein